MKKLDNDVEADFAERLNRELAERFLDEKQLAERWQICIKTLQRYRYTGQGPTFHKLGGSVRYSMTSILSFEKMSVEGAGDDYS